jgi:hypothetical protein
MRYTKTKLEKIIMIGFARIDQIIDKACDDLEGIKPKNKSASNLSDFGAIPDIGRYGLYQFGSVANATLYAQLIKNISYLHQGEAMMNRSRSRMQGGLMGTGGAMLK